MNHLLGAVEIRHGGVQHLVVDHISCGLGCIEQPPDAAGGVLGQISRHRSSELAGLVGHPAPQSHVVLMQRIPLRVVHPTPALGSGFTDAVQQHVVVEHRGHPFAFDAVTLGSTRVAIHADLIITANAVIG